MRILVTGGAGYIGSHVVLEAINKGYDVTVFDDLSTGSRENISSKSKFVKGTTLSFSDLIKLFSTNKFEAVIHLAANKAAGESMLNPRKYLKNNLIGTLNLIKICDKFKVRAFVFSSSAAVYGFPKTIPIKEDHPLLPSNYYGHTKMQIEENLKWFSKLSEMKYASLRYFNAAGYDLKRRLQSLEKNPQNLVPVIMESAVGMRSHIDIYGNDYETKDGTGVRDYIHVCDLARAHIDSIKYIMKYNKNLTLNLGTGTGFSVIDILNKTIEISKKEIEYNFTKRRSGDPDILIANSEKAKQLINWVPKSSDLDTIINSTWEVYKTHFV